MQIVAHTTAAMAVKAVPEQEDALAAKVMAELLQELDQALVVVGTRTQVEVEAGAPAVPTVPWPRPWAPTSSSPTEPPRSRWRLSATWARRSAPPSSWAPPERTQMVTAAQVRPPSVVISRVPTELVEEGAMATPWVVVPNPT